MGGRVGGRWKAQGLLQSTSTTQLTSIPCHLHVHATYNVHIHMCMCPQSQMYIYIVHVGAQSGKGDVSPATPHLSECRVLCAHVSTVHVYVHVHVVYMYNCIPFLPQYCRHLSNHIPQT